MMYWLILLRKNDIFCIFCSVLKWIILNWKNDNVSDFAKKDNVSDFKMKLSQSVRFWIKKNSSS